VSKTIVFHVDEEGNIVYDMDGFQGEACFQEAERLLEALAELGVAVEVSDAQRKEGDHRVLATTTRPTRA
jgi:hypothetical protein